MQRHEMRWNYEQKYNYIKCTQRLEWVSFHIRGLKICIPNEKDASVCSALKDMKVIYLNEWFNWISKNSRTSWSNILPLVALQSPHDCTWCASLHSWVVQNRKWRNETVLGEDNLSNSYSCFPCSGIGSPYSTEFKISINFLYRCVVFAEWKVGIWN
jgi:hypothetical protein